MSDERERWEGTLPGDPGEPGVFVSGIYPTLKLQKMALRMVSKADKQNPLIAMKESQENLIRLCVRQVGDTPVTSADLRGAGLEEHLTHKQLYMLNELFEEWQVPDQGEVADFLGSIQLRSSSRTSSKKPTGDDEKPPTGS